MSNDIELLCVGQVWYRCNMMTSSNGSIFRVTGPLWGEFTGHWWIPLPKASDAELWCFLWSAPWINGWGTNSDHRGVFCAMILRDRRSSRDAPGILKVYFLNSLYRTVHVAWAFAVKLSLGECHRSSLMINQQLNRCWQTTSYYLRQCWFMSPFSVKTPQWVNSVPNHDTYIIHTCRYTWKGLYRLIS